jgi:hypothetical protein
MNKSKMFPKLIFIFLLFFIFCSYGCTVPLKFKKSTTASSATSVSTQNYSQTAPIREFSDIAVPKRLTIDTRSSYMIETHNLATGVLVYKGRMRRDELVNFFKTNMADENWRLVTIFKSPQTNSIMLFNKEPRWCIINMLESNLGGISVEIGVVPSSEVSDISSSNKDTYVPIIKREDIQEKIIE